MVGRVYNTIDLLSGKSDDNWIIQDLVSGEEHKLHPIDIPILNRHIKSMLDNAVIDGKSIEPVYVRYQYKSDRYGIMIYKTIQEFIDIAEVRNHKLNYLL